MAVRIVGGIPIPPDFNITLPNQSQTNAPPLPAESTVDTSGSPYAGTVQGADKAAALACIIHEKWEGREILPKQHKGATRGRVFIGSKADSKDLSDFQC